MPSTYLPSNYNKLNLLRVGFLRRGFCQPFVAQLLPDEQTRPMKAGFYGPFIQAHDRSDFFGAEAFHIPQHQDHSVPWRQCLDGLIENAAQFFVLKGFLGAETM